MLTALSLESVGQRAEGRDPRAIPIKAFIALIALDVWEWTPLVFLILLAGLQSLPQEPFEAAQVDGAGRLANVCRPDLADDEAGARGRDRAEDDR